MKIYLNVHLELAMEHIQDDDTPLFLPDLLCIYFSTEIIVENDYEILLYIHIYKYQWRSVVCKLGYRTPNTFFLPMVTNVCFCKKNTI